MAREEHETTAIEPLSPVSRLFVSPSLYCFIIFTLGFETRCNQSSIVEGVKNTWIKLPRFSSKVEMKKNGKAFWIPVSVRVEDHVIVPDLDYSNIENPDQFLEDYTSNIANIPMDMSRPLWELHLLNIKTSNAESLAIGKFHHSLGDGMSLMSLLLASSRKTSDPDAFPTTAATKRHVDSNDKGWWLVGRFWFMLRVIFTIVIEMFKYLLTLCFMRDTKTPLVGKTGDSVGSSKVIHRIISFDDVKLVKNTMKMKVNDVLLAMTQAGLSRYLKKKSDTVVQKKKILEKMLLRGTVFINLRADTKSEELANMMVKGSKCRWGNFVGVVMFPSWIRSEDDSLEYVRRAKSIMDIKKLSTESLLCYGLIKFTMKIFGEQAAETLIKRIFDHTTLTFSNVLGPDEEIRFFGHPMSYVAASALGGPQAPIIHYVSYVNKIVINLAVDTTVIPDPHLLCDDLVESLDIIKLAAMEKGVHKMEV
ncbi:PREDICTED: O-acyltransferase WSD1-like isoform X1 [Camelina sativa]|uniref:O-acyltransferase WSD1-like isoform X1 n=2 Tax=Camelina sativa TaxID=90675 RepID=A0ABM0ZL19_CAMSA|nr:PREDICTED: O-acyltransferase WSD1-like isoform X1 [Camelina sativa]